ncbi:MAG: hypothetical protein AAFX58_05355 [Pseudomonadota bacterium]
MASAFERAYAALTVLAMVARLSRSAHWDRDRIRDYQHRRLAAQLRHATRNVPYYRDLGPAPSLADPPQALAQLPLLNKSIVQREGSRLLWPDEALDESRASTTSGSSGQPTTTWFDRDSWLLSKYALKIRRTLGAGPLLGQRLMIFDESSRADGRVDTPKFLRLPLFAQVRLSAFTALEAQAEVLRQFRPTTLYGAPSALAELAGHAQAGGRETPAVATLFTSSELLSAATRRTLEQTFAGRVTDIYGSTEFKEVAVQCRHGHYHVNFESVYVETVPDPDGAGSRVVLTSLVNRAMPLLRMDIGDYASLGDTPCPCGLQSPYLHGIRGREVEYLTLADGRRLSPYLLTTHIEKIGGIARYQFLQRAGGAVCLLVVPDADATETAPIAAALQEALARLLGSEAVFDIRFVAVIERTAAGKHRIVATEP